MIYTRCGKGTLHHPFDLSVYFIRIYYMHEPEEDCGESVG